MLGTTLHHRFRLEQALHRGASGTLYLATDERTGEMLAVKVFPPRMDLTADDGLRYARAMARLTRLAHPQLLLPRHTGVAEGVAFQVLPYFPGHALSAALADGPLPPGPLIQLLQQLAAGLEALHHAGLFHLNLKPTNVLLSREDGNLQAVLCDPLRGLLTPPLPDDGDLAAAACLAPEQAPWLEAEVDTAVDHRADLYALGALGYLAATGKPPFAGTTAAGATAADVWQQHALADPPDLLVTTPQVPPALAALLRRLLSPHPRDRFQSATALRAALATLPMPEAQGALQGEGRGTQPAPPQSPAQSPPSASPPSAAPPPALPLPDAGQLLAAGPSLVGRAAALEAVLSALARASAGQGALLRLVGEAGSGHTALLRELRLHLTAARARVLCAEAVPGAEAPPFHLPVALLQSLLARWEGLPEAQRKALGRRLRERLGDQAAVPVALVPALRMLLPEAEEAEALPLGRERPRVLHALCEVFRALAEPGQPLVLWIDQPQAADEDSLDWLARLARGVGSTPLLVVLAVPPGVTLPAAIATGAETDAETGSQTEVPLLPLQPGQVAARLGEALGLPPEDSLPARLGDWLCERWGGLPLAHDLALRGLLARGLLQRRRLDDGRSAWHCDWPRIERASWPESFAALVQHRLELLPQECWPVLQAVAMEPGGLAFGALCALLETMPAALAMDRVEQAVAEGVLVWRRGRVAFAHGALREAVRHALPAEQRANLHAALGAETELEQGGPPLEHDWRAAQHFRAAEDRGRFVAHGLRLVGASGTAGALRMTCRWAEQLVPLLAGDARLPDLRMAAGIARAQLGDAAPAITHLDAARALGLPEPAHLQALACSAWAERARGEEAEALRRVEEGLVRVGEALPAHAVGTALARLGGAAARRYESLRVAAGGEAAAPLSARDLATVELLALASQLLSVHAPQRAVLADERILRLTAGRAATPHRVAALLRLGAAEGDPDSPCYAQARSLLERHDFPYAEAAFQFSLGRCRLLRGQWGAAREALRAALGGFRNLGALPDEVEALRWLVELLRLEGSPERLRKSVAMLADAAAVLGAPRHVALATGLAAYAEAYAGAWALDTALPVLVQQAAALPTLGGAEEARYLLALAAELTLAAGDLGAYLAVLHAESALPPPGQGYGEGLWLAVQAEGHLVQAAHLPEEADHHLQQARTQLRDLRALYGLPLRADLARAEVLERFLTTADDEARALAAEALTEMDGEGLRLPAAWLRHRVAEALKAAGDPHWLHWAGEALTTFDAVPAPLHLRATRQLLEMDAPHPAEAAAARDMHSPPQTGRRPGQGAQTVPPPERLPDLLPERLPPPPPETAADQSDDTLLLRLERVARQGARPDDALRMSLLEGMVRAVDAAYGCWVLAGDDGRPVPARTYVLAEAERPPSVRSLVEAVRRVGQPQLLEHYLPPAAPDAAAPAVPQAHSLLGLPLNGPAGVEAVVVLGATTRRTVFDRTDLVATAARAREAAALLAVNRRLRRERTEAMRLTGALEQQQRQTAWAAQAAALDDPQALLAAYVTHVAQAAGVAHDARALLCWRGPESVGVPGAPEAPDSLMLAAVHGVMPAPEALAGLFPLALAPGQAEAALQRQAPVPGAALDAPAPTPGEQALLRALGGGESLWLPLTLGGRSFGMVLWTGRAPAVSGTDGLEQRFMVPLRLIAPALHGAWRTATERPRVAALEVRSAETEQALAVCRRFLPSDWPAEPDALATALQEGLGRTAPLLAGEVRGLARPSGLGPLTWPDVVRTYYAQVQHGLSLHAGHLLRIEHPQWVAAYPAGVDGALWGAQTLHELLLGLEADTLAEGGPSLFTGMGLHVGPLRWEPLGPEVAAPPLLTGSGVRIAGRLAAMSRTFRCGLLVSRDSMEQLAEPRRFDLRPLGRMRPAPGEERLEVHELYSVRDPADRLAMRTLHGLWDEALREFRRGHWSQAAGNFARYARELPHDRPARFFLRQARQRARS